MDKFDLAIVGNGVIGTLTALTAAEAGLRVALVGRPGRPGSASMAAGAMLNVLGEVDGPVDDYVTRKIEIGHRAIAMWRKLLPAEIFVADQTHIYKKSDRTELEVKCFGAIAEAAKVTPQRIGDKDVVLLKDEPAVSTPDLFAWLDARLAALGVLVVETPPPAAKVVRCAGSFTAGAGPLPLFYGVGNAMTLSDVDLKLPPRTVLRTPNRGNTCGLHIVPRGRSYYVGAGSYLATGPSDGYRFETLRYLIECLEADFGVETWQAAIQPLKGYRPISFDGKPLLGPLRAEPNVYVATGTKRDGLTYAPVIAEDILNWVKGAPRGVFDGWEPDRKPISYGPKDYAIDVYIANRRAALNEHGRDRAVEDLRKDAEAAYQLAHKKFDLPADFGLHPEILHVI